MAIDAKTLLSSTEYEANSSSGLNRSCGSQILPVSCSCRMSVDLVGRMVLVWRKQRVVEWEWDWGSEEFMERALCDTSTAALKIELMSVKFGLLLLSCAAIKRKK